MPASHAFGPACIFPFDFRREPIASQPGKLGFYLHSLRILTLRVWFVAPLLLRDTLLLAEPVAIGRCVEPANELHWAVPGRSVIGRIAKTRTEPEEFFDTYLVRGNRKIE